MTEYKIKDFITAIKHVVMFNSADAVCYRLNAFAIIDDTFNWDTDSIEAKAEPEFYFSRDKGAMLYPALAISFSAESLGKYRNNKYNDRCITFAIGVVDQYKGDCTNCSPCDKRGKTQIYLDAGDLLTKVINAISNITLYKTTKGADVAYHYEHPDVMALLLTQGIYDTAVIEKAESGIIHEMFQKKNENISYIEMNPSKQNTLAKYATITLCEFCNDTSMNFTYKTYQNQPCC